MMERYIEETKDRLKFFREVQLWPTSQVVDYENWLENFKTIEEKRLAAQVLRNFVYLPDVFVNKMLQIVVGKCGRYFSANDPSWTHDSFKTNCLYSFIQGEEKDDVTDSGYIFTRKLRDELHIPTKHIFSFEKLLCFLETMKTPQNVILVDDFVGTGAQTIEAWNNHKYTTNNKTLNEIVSNLHHRVIYAPLIVNSLGYNNIQKYCNGLYIEYIYLLSEGDTLLNVNGKCWNGNEKQYVDFIKLLTKVAVEERIPQTNGIHVNDMFGFGQQGLAMAFSHGIPDACPAFFYWDTTTWKPLRKRPYYRN